MTAIAGAIASDKAYDVVVLGGGIAGAAAAYHLAALGADTALVERGEFGAEASGRNAGTLNLISDRARRFDDLPFRAAALERWRGLSDELGHDLGVNLRKGTLLAAEDEAELDRLRELRAAHRRHGIGIDWLEGSDLRAFAPYLAHHVPAAIFCPVGGLADPRTASWAYAQAAARRGAALVPRTEATAIRRTRDGYRVETSAGQFRAVRVLLAAGPWSAALAAALGVDLPLRIQYFQAARTEARPPFLLHGLRRVAGKLTLKQTDAGACVLGGGWTGTSAFPVHGTVSADALAANRAVAARLVPGFAELRIEHCWAGYDGSSVDSEPILDELPGLPGAFVSTGANSGFSHGPLLAELAARRVLGLDTAWDLAPFALSRFRRQ